MPTRDVNHNLFAQQGKVCQRIEMKQISSLRNEICDVDHFKPVGRAALVVVDGQLALEPKRTAGHQRDVVQDAGIV